MTHIRRQTRSNLWESNKQYFSIFIRTRLFLFAVLSGVLHKIFMFYLIYSLLQIQLQLGELCCSLADVVNFALRLKLYVTFMS